VAAAWAAARAPHARRRRPPPRPPGPPNATAAPDNPHSPAWEVARFTPPDPSDPPDVRNARRTLGCGTVHELLDAVAGRFGPGRAWRNFTDSVTLTRLRFPEAPEQAVREICPCGSGARHARPSRITRLLPSSRRIPVLWHESMTIRTEPETAPRVVTDGRAETRETSAVRRVVLALGLAGLAFLAAGFAAIGPANGHRDVYTWPSPSDRSTVGDGSRYAPLLLTRHHPERLTATAPCTGLAEAVAARGDAPLTLIATPPRPHAVDGRGLLVTMEQGALVTRFGDRSLMRTPWPGPQDSGAACVLRVDFHESEWRVTSGGRVLGTGRELAPNVSGLYTDLPPGTGLQT